MTRDEAHDRAAQLQAEHPERATYHFFVRDDGDDNWEVAKVPIPEQLRHGRRLPGLPGGV